MLICYDELSETFDAHFGMLTIYIDELPSLYTLASDDNVEYAYLDTHCIPDAADFVERYGIGEFTDLTTNSGFCIYPMYKLDLNRINELVGAE